MYLTAPKSEVLTTQNNSQMQNKGKRHYIFFPLSVICVDIELMQANTGREAQKIARVEQQTEHKY